MNLRRTKKRGANFLDHPVEGVATHALNRMRRRLDDDEGCNGEWQQRETRAENGAQHVFPTNQPTVRRTATSTIASQHYRRQCWKKQPTNFTEKYSDIEFRRDKAELGDAYRKQFGLMCAEKVILQDGAKFFFNKK